MRLRTLLCSSDRYSDGTVNILDDGQSRSCKDDEIYWQGRFALPLVGSRFVTEAQIAQVEVPIPMISPSVNWRLASTEFVNILDEFIESDDAPEDFPKDIDLESILVGETGDNGARIEKARKYAARLSASLASANQGHVFVNGKHFNLDDVSPS